MPLSGWAGKPEWAGGTGDATKPGNWTNSNGAPGKTDIAHVGDGTVPATYDTTNTDIGALELTTDSGKAPGKVNGSGKVTFVGNGLPSRWDSGEISFTSAGGVIFDTTSTLSITTANSHVLSGGSLTNKGATTWDGGSIDVSGNAGIINDASATFTIAADGAVNNGGGATFSNAGTLTKSAGAAGSATEIKASFANTGTVNANVGALKLSGGGSSNGNVAIGSGAEVQIGTTDFTISGGAITGSSGKLKLLDHKTTFSGATSGDAEVAVAGGTATFNSTHNGTGKLSLASGGVDGTGSATFGSLEWTGGTVGTNVTTNGGTIGAGTTKTISAGGKLNAGGTTTLSDDLGTGAGAELNTSGTFTINSGNVTHDAGAAAATIKNSGAFKKATSSVSQLDVSFDNTATGASLAVDGGTLKLAGGGSSSKGVTVADGAKLQIGTSNYTFSGGTLDSTGTGAIEVTGATTIFSGTSGSANVSVTSGTAAFSGAHSGNGKLSLSAGGTVSGNGGATFGSLEWKGGTINGKVTATGSAAMVSGTDAKTIDASGDLTVSGGSATTTAWTGNVSNAGKLTHAGGQTDIQSSFSNTGTLAASAGTLKLSGGGSSSGVNNKVDVGGTLQIGGNNYTFDTTSFSGTGTVDLNGATTTFKGASGNAKVNLSGGNADFNGSASAVGSLTLGSSTSTVTTGSNGSVTTSSLTWTDGKIDGKVTGNAASVSGNAKTIGTNGDLTVAGGSATTTAWTGGAVTNQGKFTHSSGQTDIQSSLTNNGTLTASAGTLKLSGGGSSSGVNNKVDVGGTLQIGGNNYTFDTTSFSGTGTVDLNGATTTFKGASGNAKVNLSGGNADFNGSASAVGSLTLGSSTSTVTTGNNGSVTTGSLTWTGGSVNAKVNSGGGTIGGPNAKSLGAGADVTLTGNTTWDGSTISASGSAKLKNDTAAIFSAGDGLLSSDGTTSFTNAGTFKKSAGTGETNLQTTFDSSGSIVVDDNKGTLKLSGGGRSTGGVSVGAGATVKTANNYTFESGALNGAGTIEVNGGTTTFKNTTGNANLSVSGGAANIDTSHSTSGKLSLSNGSVGGTGTATVGSLEWTGGSVNAKVNSGGGSIGGPNAKSLGAGADVTLTGNTTWDGSTISTSGSAKLKNDALGTFIAGDGLLSSDGTTTFTNVGAFKKSLGTGQTDIQARFDNSGSIFIDSGTLKLSGGGVGRANSGIFVAGAASFEIASDLTLDAQSQLTGTGRAKLSNGVLTANGSVGIATLDFTGGQLAGTQDFTGTLNWHGGNWDTITGAITTIANGGVLNIGNGVAHSFNFRQVVNEGTVNWQSGDLRGGNGSSIVNRASFYDQNSGTVAITKSGLAGTFTFTNNGLYNKSGIGTTVVDVPFVNNNGSIRVDGGTIQFTNTFTQNGGTFILRNNATAQFDQGLTFASGLLGGNGVIKGNVSNGGLLSPGTSPGLLDIVGDLNLINSSVLLIELGGLVKGTSYDFVNVSGMGQLGGTLSLSFTSGFNYWTQITPATTFTILTAAGGLTGSFGNIANGQRLSFTDGPGNFLSFQVNYGPSSAFTSLSNSVVLSNFVAVPEPSTWVMLAVGTLAVLTGVVRRRRR